MSDTLVMNFGDSRLPERFWSKVHPCPITGCWLWTGSIRNRWGYGSFALFQPRRTENAHRVPFLAVGQIPDGFHIDHLCRVPACVNPAHLEPVTPRENVMRGVSHVASNRAKTLCPAGHRYADHAYVDKKGKRSCRVCGRDRKRARDARAKLGTT